MEQPDMKFVALHDIPLDYDATSAVAFRTGDLVHESAVIGPSAWLKLGIDVEARPGLELAMPDKNASQALWAAYAVGKGAKPEDAEGATRAQLIKQYGPADAKS
jgi:hypothetical protein